MVLYARGPQLPSVAEVREACSKPPLSLYWLGSSTRARREFPTTSVKSSDHHRVTHTHSTLVSTLWLRRQGSSRNTSFTRSCPFTFLRLILWSCEPWHPVLPRQSNRGPLCRRCCFSEYAPVFRYPYSSPPSWRSATWRNAMRMEVNLVFICPYGPRRISIFTEVTLPLHRDNSATASILLQHGVHRMLNSTYFVAVEARRLLVIDTEWPGSPTVIHVLVGSVALLNT